jgi:hypothetical protein
VAAAIAAAVAAAAVVLLGENEVALGSIVKVAGLERLRFGRLGHGENQIYGSHH